MTILDTRRGPSPVRTSAPRADIQGLRAAAILLVVLYHSDIGLGGGFTGVDIFFVISGFVICSMFLREIHATGRISLGRFYVRRARRLLPALALMTTVTLTLSAVLLSPLGSPQETAGRAGSAASGFMANGYFAVYTGGYFQSQAEGNPFLHTWSLSVEEQFYIVFPVLLLATWRILGKRIGPPLILVLLLFALTSLVASILFTYVWLPHTPGFHTLHGRPDLSRQFAFYSPVTRAWEFIAGSVAAVMLAGRAISRRIRSISSIVGVVLLVLSIGFIRSGQAFPGVIAVLPVAGTVALLTAGATAAGPVAVSRALAGRYAGAIGDLSYSWYLWHWPLIVFAKVWFPSHQWVWLVAAFGSLFPAWLSYRWVEDPIRRRRYVTSRPATVVLIASCICVPMFGGAALTYAANNSWASNRLHGIHEVVAPNHADLIDGCASTIPLGTGGRAICTWKVPNARGTILLIGDSNAGHLTEPAVAVSRSLQMNLQVATDGGCPMIVAWADSIPGCKKVVEGDLNFINARRPAYAAIVLSNADVSYVNTAKMDHSNAIRTWVSDLQSTVRDLSKAAPVIVVGAVPQFPNVPGCLVRSVIVNHPAAGCGYLDPVAALRYRGALIAAEKKALTGLSAGYADTGDLLCSPNGGCDIYVHGALVYRDGSHLSVSGSLLFEPILRSALRVVVGSP